MSEVITIDVNPESKSDKFSTRWWAQPKDEMFKHVFGTVKMLETRQSYRTMENVRNARLYSDLEGLGVFANLYAPGLRDANLTNRISLNVVKSNIDTVTSKIAKQKPRPMFLTEDGNWSLRNKAEKLTKYIDGQFDDMGLYEVKQDTFRDSGIFGTGATKFYIDWARKKVCSERAIIEELLVDDAEALYGCPRTLFQRRLVDKDALKEAMPVKLHAFIDSATADIEDGLSNQPGMRNLVKVIEAWHLPSGPDAKDGKHVMCVNNATLELSDWDFDWFPFSLERWNKGLLGWFGTGIARELTGIQVEINKVLRRIQQSMDLFAIPRAFVENGSEVALNALNNDVASIVKYTGSSVPQFYAPQAMAPDVYNHLWNLYGKSFEIVGVSQLSASSKKPEGLDSGRALREFSDIESDRFQIVGQRREATFLADAKITIELQKRLCKEHGDAKVKVSDNGSMKTIRFSEVNLDEEKYLMRVFPASILPTQPAARMQTIVEYAQAGFFDKETAMDLMDFPDIKSATSLLISPRRVVLKQLDAMMDSGEYEAPEPFFNLALTKQLAQFYYMSMKNQGAPEDRLMLIQDYISQVVSLEQQAAQAAAPAPMPGMDPAMAAASGAGAPPTGAMPAAPEALPTNELITQGV